MYDSLKHDGFTLFFFDVPHSKVKSCSLMVIILKSYLFFEERKSAVSLSYLGEEFILGDAISSLLDVTFLCTSNFGN